MVLVLKNMVRFLYLNAIKFLDKDGNVVTQYLREGAKAPDKTEDTNTPATDDSSNKQG